MRDHTSNYCTIDASRTRVARLKDSLSLGKAALRFPLIFLICLSLFLSASACGTSDGLDERGQSFDFSSIPTNKKIQSMLPQELREKGVLTVGTNAAYAPAEYTGEDSRVVLGYEIDLIKGIAKVMGLKTQIVQASFNSIIPAVGKKYTVGVSGFTITAEREKSVNFVQHYRSGMSFVVNKGNPKKITVNNLCGRKISVQTGTMQETDAGTMSEKCLSRGKPAITIRSYRDQPSATIALISKQVDAMYTDTPVGEYAVKETEGKLQMLGKAKGVAPMGIVIAKNDMATARAIRAALQILIDSGTYRKILSSWGVTSGIIKKAVINPKLKSTAS